MNVNDSIIFVCVLLGAMSVFFVIAGFVSDYVWPWLGRVWHARNARPQATYRSKA